MANSTLDTLPDISFIEDLDIETFQGMMVSFFEEGYENATGESIELSKSDPYKIILDACTTYLYQGLQYVDLSGKQNLLKYSSGDNLDNVAALKNVTRNDASAAVCTIRFTLSEAQSSDITIPEGTRCSGADLYFAVDEDTTISAGDTYADVACTCTTTGTEGNDIAIGEISTLVDSVSYVASVSNIDVTSGGAAEEDDDNLAYRAYIAPSAYSVAGPSGAYEYHTKAYSSDIADVNVTSPNPKEVYITFILSDGSLPNETLISNVQEYLSDETIRPLSDEVTVAAPETISYNIEATYYIAESNESVERALVSAIEEAAEEYQEWQDTKIGRDINPSKLINLLMVAGAKRVEVTSPTFTSVDDGYIAQVGTVTLTYGGIESD